jgi:hypothetical protein
MNIINKYELQTIDRVAATDDINPATGNQSPKWVGVLTGADGATGNVAAGAGLIQLANSSVVKYKHDYVDAIFAVSIDGTIKDDAANYIKIPFHQLGVPNGAEIIGAEFIGSQKDAVNSTALFNVGDYQISVHRENYLVVTIADDADVRARALNGKINIRLTYRHPSH